MPTLVLHSDDDQLVPIGAAGLPTAQFFKGAELKVYKGAPHGMPSTLKDRVNADLLDSSPLRCMNGFERPLADVLRSRVIEMHSNGPLP